MSRRRRLGVISIDSQEKEQINKSSEEAPATNEGQGLYTFSHANLCVRQTSARVLSFEIFPLPPAGVDQHGLDSPESGPPAVRLLFSGSPAGDLPLPQPALLPRHRRSRPPGAARMAGPRRQTLRHHPVTPR